tara:strand:- start:168 stop:512 length:345 start_codon:yes stop_codon:yes gene_type:complete
MINNLYIKQDEIIAVCKTYIKDNDLLALKSYYKNMLDWNINAGTYQYIYQKIFLHACIIGQINIIQWLFEVYKEFDNISKITLRQMFFYGKYLLKKHKFNIEWYDTFLKELSNH